MIRLRAAAALAVFTLAGVASAQLRVATWNISNWGVTNVNDARSNAVKTVVHGVFNGRSMSPDVILVQEITSANALTTLRNALNQAAGSPGDWASAPFLSSPDTSYGFLYRTSRVQFLSTTTVSVGGNAPEPPRNTYRHDFRPIGYPVNAATIASYNAHLKAGTTTSDEARRLLEAQRIRGNAETIAGQIGGFIVAGDLNTQSSSDDSYVELTGSQTNNAGRLFDPIVTPGSWNNSSTFRFVHTQDHWDGASAGGMDDRYDYILLSSSLVDRTGMDYVGNPTVPYSTTTWNDPNHSYRVWGNDGSYFNDSINTTSNAMVGPTIASALLASLGNQSGHLPVFLDLTVPPLGAASTTRIDFGTLRMLFPTLKTFTISNTGNTTLWGANGIAPLRYTLSSSSPRVIVGGGPFTEAAGGGTNTHVVTINTMTPGPINETITVMSNDPVNPVRTIQITGTVSPAFGRP